MTYMGTFGAQKGKWGFLTDVIYMDISKDINKPLDLINPNIVVTNIGMKSWVVTPIVTYRVMEEKQFSLDVLAGARYLYVKIPLELNIGSTSSSADVWNGIVGVRGKYDLNEKWYMQSHLDIGTGETKSTWQAFAGIGYKYDNFDFHAGYRHMEWDFDSSDTGGELMNNLRMSGPIIGAKFNF